MRKVVIALAALVVGAGAAWYITRADNAETVALDHLRASMRDPDSTTFQNVSVYRFRGPDDIQMAFVCGDVNSKNALGGYAGNRSFVVAFTDEPKAANISLAKIAGADWQPWEMRRKFDDYMRDDVGEVDAFCSLGMKDRKDR